MLPLSFVTSEETGVLVVEIESLDSDFRYEILARLKIGFVYELVRRI